MSGRHFAGIFVAALLLALSLGALFAEAGKSVPGFDVIYPKPQGKLVFSHQRHAEIDCLTCHGSVKQSTKATDRNLPAEAQCASCHNDSIRRQPNEAGTLARCSICHTDYDPSHATRPSRIYWPEPNIIFPHDVHVMRMIACETCHEGISVSEQSGGRHLPKEAACLKCHERRGKDKGCGLCHPGKPSGMLETAFSGVHLLPLQGRMNHGNDWQKRHVRMAQIDRQSCAPCHQQRYCDSCHDGVLKPVRIHPEDYVTSHSIDARKNDPNCSSCHRYQSFCLDCHRKTGVTTDAVRKDARTQIHPPGWASCSRTPTHHSDQARRNLAACVACHTESDCLRCHRAGAECGGGVNIHGHMSSGQLSRMQKLNPRACEKCHGK